MVIPTSRRILSIDILRGIVMVIMALDHTRDFFSNYNGSPTDLTQASTGMFLTRWITHFCAPVFIFLSGTSAFLSLSRGKTKKQAAGFLFKRGVWLIILELTLVRFGWQFNLDYTQIIMQVIWAIGWSMIFLSGLIFLPMPLILSIGLIMIFGHNTLDYIKAESFGDNAIWWHFLHEFGVVNLGDTTLFIIYPLIPWIGVMATGYCFGRLFQKPDGERYILQLGIGFSAIILFILLRYINTYGDPNPWSMQPTWSRTVLSFINCTKYPPSLLYLLMTIGPAIAIMPFLERMQNAVGNFFIVYGRVPMFYYVLHIYLIHGMALVVALTKGIPASYFTSSESLFGPKPNWGYDLPYVYLWWALAVALLYFPCRWFMRVKAKNKTWWLSYI